jgi:hypothetical protein
LPGLLVKIVSLPPLAQHLPHFGMQLVNPHSSIAAKEIFESALLSLNAYLVSVTLFQSVHH